MDLEYLERGVGDGLLVLWFGVDTMAKSGDDDEEKETSCCCVMMIQVWIVYR